MQTTRSLEFRGKQLTLAGRRGEDYFENARASDLTGDMLTRVALHGLRPDAIIFDVGANIGLTAMSLATLLPQSRLFCFEPSPTAWPHLVETIRLNGLTNQCRTFNRALGKQPGTCTFTDHPLNPCFSHLADGNDTLPEVCGTEAPQVTVSTVDAIRSEFHLERVDFIKIDVEGFEGDVLAGAKETIRQCNPLIIAEFNSYTLIAFKNVNPRSLLEQWMSMFREIYWVSKGELVRIHDQASLKQFIHSNLILHGCINDLLCVPHGYPGTISEILAASTPPESLPVAAEVKTIAETVPIINENPPKQSAWRNMKTWIKRLKSA